MATPFDLNLRHLDAALAVRRLGSITGAASAVNLSQPTLTQALAQMEDRLDHRLFDRQPGGVAPTEAGLFFIDRVERAIERIGEACRAVRRLGRLPPLAFPERRISMTQVRAFLAVAQEGSFALAARALGLSQPSVHRAAKELELVLGTPLFLRVGQRLRGTAAGDRLARGLRLALVELRAGLDELAALRAAGSGRIVIGTLPLPRAWLLPTALARFAGEHPRADVSVIEAPYADLLSALRDGEIDLLLGALRQDPGGDVVQESLLEDDLFVVGSARHPLAGQPLDPAELARFPWIVAVPGAPMRATWESLFSGAPRPERIIQCTSILTARGMLLAGDWLALMSRDQFRIEQEAGLLAAIGAAVPGSRRRIGLTTRAGWKATGTQDALIDAIRATAQTPH